MPTEDLGCLDALIRGYEIGGTTIVVHLLYHKYRQESSDLRFKDGQPVRHG